jgi:poly-gamma-glutamate synthesis protein (capsule biosynthesis protein)
VTASATLALAGDVMLGRGVNRRISESGPRYPWGDVLTDIRRADLFLINLECALTSHRKRWRNGTKAFYFRAHPRTVKTLQSARDDYAALANNHAVDNDMTALLDTVRHLDAAGIAHAGAGADLEAAAGPAILSAGHWRIAVLAYADYPIEWAAGTTTPGINYTPISVAADDFSAITHALEATRRRADLVIVSIHWGPNMRERPTPEYRDFARHVIDAGADVFWGHSAHLVHGVELWHDKPILFDTGDFVDDYAVDPDLRNDLSALFVLTVRPPVIDRVDLIPVTISDRQVNHARGTDREWFCQRFATLSAELGTDVHATDGSPVILVSDSARAGASAS